MFQSCSIAGDPVGERQSTNVLQMLLTHFAMRTESCMTRRSTTFMELAFTPRLAAGKSGKTPGPGRYSGNAQITWDSIRRNKKMATL
eukprot:1366398-Amphidinium_carterae.3